MSAPVDVVQLLPRQRRWTWLQSLLPCLNPSSKRSLSRRHLAEEPKKKRGADRFEELLTRNTILNKEHEAP